MPPRDVTGVAQAVRARTPVTGRKDPEIGGEGRAGGPRITMGPIARGMLVVLLVDALASALWLVRDVLFITFFSVLVASFLSLFIDPLHKRYGWRRSVTGPV